MDCWCRNRRKNCSRSDNYMVVSGSSSKSREANTNQPMGYVAATLSIALESPVLVMREQKDKGGSWALFQRTSGLDVLASPRETGPSQAEKEARKPNGRAFIKISLFAPLLLELMVYAGFAGGLLLPGYALPAAPWIATYLSYRQNPLCARGGGSASLAQGAAAERLTTILWLVDSVLAQNIIPVLYRMTRP